MIQVDLLLECKYFLLLFKLFHSYSCMDEKFDLQIFCDCNIFKIDILCVVIKLFCIFKIVIYYYYMRL